MKTKKCNGRLIVYELVNLAGNPFIAFFGCIFPILMLLIMSNAITGDVPESMVPKVNTAIFITMSLIVSMAVVLLGHSANYSQEMEKEIPVRLNLFGIPQRSIMLAKGIAQAVVLTLGLFFYTTIAYLTLDMEVPAVSTALCLLLCHYILAAIFFGIAHGLSGILKKFGPTYAITMVFYFGAMILCGMMGVQTNELPKALRYVAGLLPMSYIGSDFIDFWQGGSYNFGPMIQSYLFLGAVCGILLLAAGYKNRRVVK